MKLVCDDCLEKKPPIKYAIEIYVEDFEVQIIYHPVDELKDLPADSGINRVRDWWG